MAANLTVKDVKEGMALPVLEKAVKPVTVVLGAMASRDWRPQHHDFKFATGNNGLDDIIMNTPNLAAWFEERWTDRFSLDITAEIIDLIANSWADEEQPTPFEVYLKVCHSLSQDARDGMGYVLPKSMSSAALIGGRS